MAHRCKDKDGALQDRVLDAKGRCPECGTVCKVWTQAELDAQKAAYEAKGGVWGPNPKEPPAV